MFASRFDVQNLDNPSNLWWEVKSLVNNGFRFSTSKTVTVHFCRRRRHCPDMEIRLHRQQIPVQPAAKFLGVMLDNRLTYKQHIKEVRDKCFRSLNVLKCVARTSYGADRSTLLLLYRSLIRSKLDYASFVYDSSCQSNKKPLDTIHHAAIRIVTGAFRTTPIESLLVEVNKPPLDQRRQLSPYNAICNEVDVTEASPHSAQPRFSPHSRYHM